MFKKVLGPFVLLFVLVVASVAHAGDLTGTWKPVDSWGVAAGNSQHKISEGDSWREADTFTIKIVEEGHDGRAFHGEFCSPSQCEDLVGAVRTDGTILMVDEDGYFEGRLVGKSLEMCYMEAGKEFKIIHCRILEKE